MILRICLSVLVLLATCASFAEEPKTIHWLFFEMPGLVNFKDNREKPGYILDIYSLLKSKMPEYNHQVIDIPFSKIIQRLKKKQGVCSFMILKNSERESYAHFGAPLLKGLPAGIIIKKNNPKLQKYLKTGKVLDLEILLQDKSIQFGSIADRFYGTTISSTLKKYRNPHLIEKKGAAADQELRSMVKLGRIDVYFGYPFEVAGSERLEFYFAKGDVDLLEPRISCEKTEFGKAVVDRTEELRAKLKLDQQFNSIYERYYPKDLQDEFWKLKK